MKIIVQSPAPEYKVLSVTVIYMRSAYIDSVLTGLILLQRLGYAVEWQLQHHTWLGRAGSQDSTSLACLLVWSCRITPEGRDAGLASPRRLSRYVVLLLERLHRVR